MQDLRGHLSRPLNREHFYQLCHHLVDEHWGTSFTFDSRSIERSEKVRFWTRLRETDSVIGINCQWRGRGSSAPTPEQIDHAVALADVFHTPIDLFFMLFSGDASDQLNKHVAQLNQQRKAEGKFLVQLWDWYIIEEQLATCPRTVNKYLTLSVAMNPNGFTSAIDPNTEKAVWLKRLPNGKKKDRNNSESGSTPQAAFNHSIADAFERYIHANQYRSNSRYLRVANAPEMGHAVALIHDDHQIELWLLTPEPRDTEFRVDTEMWVHHLMERTVKSQFAHVLLKNYHAQERIRLHIYFVRQNALGMGSNIAFATYPAPAELSWNRLYPGESLRISRYVLADALIEGDQIKVTQSIILYGCTLTHVYNFPISSTSTTILKSTLVSRSFPNAVPHSHKILLDDEQIYWRPLGQFEAHTRRQENQQPTPVMRMTCQFCNGTFWGYRGEKRCAVCDFKQGIFGRSTGASLTFNELFKQYIARSPWDF